MNDQNKAFRWSLLTTIIYVSFMVTANVVNGSIDTKTMQGRIKGYIVLIWIILPIVTGVFGTIYFIRAWGVRSNCSSRWRLYLSPFLLVPGLLILLQWFISFYIHM